MKNLILGLILASSPFLAQAKDQPLSYMKDIVADEKFVGTEGKDYKCSFTTKWKANGDLVVTAVQQYKKSKPSYETIVFSKGEGAVVEIENSDDDITEYKVVQSKIIKEEEDYTVTRYESFSAVFDASRLLYLTLSIAVVDNESDPSEDLIRCSKLKEQN